MSTSTPVAYAPPCASTLALKTIVTGSVMPVMMTTSGRLRARPFGRHAVSRQIARHEIEQARQRRRAGEPENGDRADVVDRAEAVAETLVREIRQRAAVGRVPGLECIGGNEHRRHEAAAEQQHAHDDAPP